MRTHATALALALIGGCRCGAPETMVEPTDAPHYGEWELLVRRTAQGDLDAARRVARDLTEGAPAEFPGGEEASARVGAALGYLQTLEETEDGPMALGRAAVGCGACHQIAAVEPPPRPGAAHRDGGSEALYEVIWAGAGPDQAVSALEACVGCHVPR